MKDKIRINQEAKRIAEIPKYITVKWYQIMEETGLRVSFIPVKGNKGFWEVQDEKDCDFKTLKKGSFKSCIDFILNEWKNETKRYVFSYSELKPEARLKSAKKILNSMDFALEDAKINSYNKCQLETTCNKLRTQLIWLKGALDLS